MVEARPLPSLAGCCVAQRPCEASAEGRGCWAGARNSKRTCSAFRTERCPYPRGARAPGRHNFGQPPTDWGWPSAGWT
eukprot:11173872-Alexandrium_andersonii.AAC.1